MTEKTIEKIEKFFEKVVKVYEGGKVETAIQDRPYLKTLPGGQTVFLENIAKENKTKRAYKVSLNAPIPNGKLESNTESSKFLKETEQRFKTAKPNVSLLIIDPDIIQESYALDKNPKKNMFATFATYLATRMAQEGVSRDFPLQADDFYQLYQASMVSNSPLSATMPTGKTQANPKGKGQFSIVIAPTPDHPVHDMFTSIPGSKKRLEEAGLGMDDVRRMILYHELGHALDQRNPYDAKDHFLDSGYKRHRTECVADVFATLALAKESGNTKMAKLVADIRSDNTAQGLFYVSKQAKLLHSRRTKELELGETDGTFEDRAYYSSPELQSYIKEAKAGTLETSGLKANGEGSAGKPIKAKEPKVKLGNFSDEHTTEEKLGDLEYNGLAYKILTVTGSIASYNTTPCVDAAIKEAESRIADGSIANMSDAEMHKLAESIVDTNALSREAYAKLCFGTVMRETTPESDNVIARYKEAQGRFPEDPLAEQKAAMAAMGLPHPDDQLKPAQAVEINRWRRALEEKISERGGSEQDVIDVIREEKDSVRPEDGIVREYKIANMNQLFLESAKQTAIKAKTISKVSSSINAIESPKVEQTGLDALVEYIVSDLKTYEYGDKAVGEAAKRDFAEMDIDQQFSSMGKERKYIKDILKSEKKTQNLAFAIRKDEEAWKAVSAQPSLSYLIGEKAKKRHPEWIDKMYMSLGKGDKDSSPAVANEVEVNKFVLANLVLTNDIIADAVLQKSPSTYDKLAKSYDEYVKKMNAGRKGMRKEAPVVDAGRSKDITWNYMSKFKFKGAR